MPAPTIPGYYYDDLKKKYFKVVPNHVAPAGSKYSEQSVKREAEDLLVRRRHESFDQRMLQTRIDRRRLRNQLLGGCAGLGREIEGDFDPRSAGLGAWAQGLESKTVIESDSGRLSGLFAHDDATGGLIIERTFVAEASGERQSRLAYAIPIGEVQEGLVDCVWAPTGIALDSEICSLAISPSRVLMTTAMGGSRPACVQLTTLTSSETINDYARTHSQSDSSPIAESVRNQPIFNSVSDLSILLRSSAWGVTFWSSSARPLITHSDFALGTSSCTILVTSSESSWSFSQSMSFAASYSDGNVSQTEILALDWLSENTIINGCRDGNIRLWDVRVPTSAGTSSPLKHASSIAHVRARNQNRIVVAGIDNQLCTYDLRFLTAKSSFQPGASTMPYLRFPAYKNRDLNGLAVGFDVKGDLVAAGTDDKQVQVFDGETGKELQTGNGGELRRRKLAGTARCVKLEDGVDGEAQMRLYMGTGQHIKEWAWLS